MDSWAMFCLCGGANCELMDSTHRSIAKDMTSSPYYAGLNVSDRSTIRIYSLQVQPFRQ
jgi:hypothetical protein